MSGATSKILYLLKQNGPMPLPPLAEALELTTMGVRQHLHKLEQQGLVAFEDRRFGPGRPSRHWYLSDAGHRQFGDRHQDLTLQLLDGIDALFGAEGLNQLISHRFESQKALYLETLAEAKSLGERVEKLARLRHQEGYMARVVPQGEGWLLVEDHCPICAAAARCRGLCQQELELFRTVLGDTLSVTRSEHLLEQGSRCAYLITPSKAAC
ncbi:helix-turn-helix transcriptional regulator [Ferrimonas balearica]|uniref:helix-turn-helix transcriptional regulator n=1 Tax=Ferrimonas balearica TaxID=44012 RepID=UPI001C9A27A8|nr:metalloregulator ArsR/SmtB family transcription factor [Ferrimonas balearica]MBY5922314.1 transcriptional regulator [Ferrimonas balearica]MBY5994346.1 transcriptional regulator [Ferrimonas balearica]